MACSRPLDHRAVVWSREDSAGGIGESERDVYKAAQPGAVYRFRVRPIPYAVSVWIRGLHFHGQRHAGQV